MPGDQLNAQLGSWAPFVLTEDPQQDPTSHSTRILGRVLCTEKEGEECCPIQMWIIQTFWVIKCLNIKVQRLLFL